MKARRGTMLMEAVLVLPLLMVMICCIFQLSGLAMARVMTEYAAYAAARTLVVSSAADRFDLVHEAAARALAPVSGCPNTGVPTAKWARSAIRYPGWGQWLDAGWLDRQVHVKWLLVNAGSPLDPAKYHQVTVDFDYPLNIPLASDVLSTVFPNDAVLDGTRTIRLSASACAVGLTDEIYPRIREVAIVGP